jgi:hypothetical protein
MTVTSGTHRPRSAHQAKGGHPWCAGCHTDRYLIAASPNEPNSRAQILPIAVTCTRCGDSRVLALTRVFAAALKGRVAMDGYVTAMTSNPVHCREPMSLVAPTFEYAATLQPGPANPAAGCIPTYVWRCRCGFQMDAPVSSSSVSPGRRTRRPPGDMQLRHRSMRY